MWQIHTGTPYHQALLRCVVDHYQADPRIRAVCLFGSLVRGNADEYSDLDLDIVLEDGVSLNLMAELESLGRAFEPLDDAALLVVPREPDSGDIVLASLAELSIRYHILETTSPNIVDSLMVLCGTLDLETIKSAGLANRKPARQVSSHDVDGFLRHAIEVDFTLRRGRFWLAQLLLERMRQTLIEIFAASRGHVRAYHAFDIYADEKLKISLRQSLPGPTPDSLRAVLTHLLDFLEMHLEELSSGQLKLTEQQREALAKLRQKWTSRASS